MNPLTRRDVIAHQAFVPWPLQRQVEQDLLLCLAMRAGRFAAQEALGYA
jgi:hypothetical protein